jgi:hypothetical protein
VEVKEENENILGKPSTMEKNPIHLFDNILYVVSRYERVRV